MIHEGETLGLVFPPTHLANQGFAMIVDAPAGPTSLRELRLGEPVPHMKKRSE